MSRVVMESLFSGVFWGLVLTALVWCLQAVTRRTNAGTRHAVWCVTLGAVVLLPALTVAVRYSTFDETPGAVSNQHDLNALYGFWTFGALFMLARLAVSSVRLRRLVRRATPMTYAGDVGRIAPI